MAVFCDGKEVQVWEISREGVRPDWVEEAFTKQYLRWLDNRLCILMAGINSSAMHNAKTGMVGSAGGGFAGYGMYVMGYVGDYLDASNHKVLSAKQFEKKYKIIA